MKKVVSYQSLVVSLLDNRGKMKHTKLMKQGVTYADYLTWPDDERWEIIGGVALNMSPAPGRRHQEILSELHRQMANYLFDKTCRVYLAPFDVRFAEPGRTSDKEIKDILQPDLSIVYDMEKLDDKGCLGSPDLIVEIISPASVHKDMKEKFALYEIYGVKEYWIVHPVDRVVMVFGLDETGRYGKPAVYTPENNIEVGILPGLVIELDPVFKE